jgi:hypothetical protein
MLRHLPLRTALAIGFALFFVGPAAAQYYPSGGWYRSASPGGYWVRSYGYYDGYHSPPGYGGYETYYAGRPFVTVADPWGRVADVPLRPKVLYYSDQLVTPYGGFYPTHIVVMPNDRRPVPSRSSYTPPPAVSTAPPPAATLPGPAPAKMPIPPAADLDPRPAAEAPQLPAVPELPRLPDVASVPGSAPAPKKVNTVPNLGPTPLDTTRPK